MSNTTRVLLLITAFAAFGQLHTRFSEASQPEDNDSVQIRVTNEAEVPEASPSTLADATDPLFPIRKDWRWGYMNREGKVVIEPRYDDASCFFEGLAAVKLGDKWGYVDRRGMLVIPAQFAMAGRFSSGRAAVIRRSDVRWPLRVGHIDATGKMIIKPDFFGGRDADFRDGLALVRPKGAPIVGLLGFAKRNRYIDTSGAFAFDTVFDHAKPFSDGLAKVWKDGKVMYIDTSGNVVLDVTRLHVTGDFSEGLASFAESAGPDAQYGFINRKGDVVVAPICSRACGFSEGLAAIAVDILDFEWLLHEKCLAITRWGYVDTRGTLIVEPSFAVAHRFSEGLACVSLEEGGKRGFIDRTGKMVIKPQFDSAANFVNGLAWVSMDDRWERYESPRGGGKRLVHGKIGYINHMGEYVWKPTE